MTLIQSPVGTPVPLTFGHTGSNRDLYQALFKESADADALARSFLERQLSEAAQLSSDLPDDPEQLLEWSQARCAVVAADYAGYLQSRKDGAPRRYFRSKSHALYFLQRVAPTKEVDGAWLSGLMTHWQDCRFDGLLDTYLEELGEGIARQNHVVIYRMLLADHDCADLQSLDDEDFLQGALQLALGRCSDAYLPEVIGYNLGYEQLPLHLLITAYELRELGIDPHYFRLHVTIDNASTGHGRKAVQSLLELMPIGEGREDFCRRVALGYRLNDLGVGSTAVIKNFDLHQEVLAMLERKRLYGQHMHSDYCRIEGRTVNQWLSAPGQMDAFLEALEQKQWINRGQPPQDSRFWQLIEGSGAVMFGVFSGYEKQLLHDWIANGWKEPHSRPFVHRAAPDELEAVEVEDVELDQLKTSLEYLTPDEEIRALIPWLSAQRHWRPAGLYATRRFMQLRSTLR
ncbi:iron-containing redox enzyme family protein [Pseudomonas syringae]|nr:iron-containing redox enzyme family protein [Pseudomonas syringae]MCF5069125.1 iron-containing redox enzyme family protein [Pseudomonas syringae]